MRSEQELRDAFDRLVGDPASDAVRVLERVGREDRQVRPGPRPFWPWLTTAAAAGLLFGVLLGRNVGVDGAATVPTDTGPTDVAAEPPAEELLAVLARQVGEVAQGGSPAIAANRIAVGARITSTEPLLTGEKGAFELRLTSGALVRGGPLSEFIPLGKRNVTLMRGRLWVQVPDEGAASCAVETGQGLVEITQGATVDLEATPNELYVHALAGRVRFETLAGEEFVLRERQWVASRDLVVGGVESFERTWPVVSWQTTLLTRSGAAEVAELLMPMVPDIRDLEVERDLRAAGQAGAEAIGMTLVEAPPEDPATYARMAEVLSDVATYPSMYYVFVLLQSNVPEYRVMAARAIERISGVPSGRDLEFWKTGSPAARFDVVREWRGKVFYRGW